MPATIIAATLTSFLTFGLPKLLNAVTADRRQDVRFISAELRYIHAFCRKHSKSGVATSEELEIYLKDMEQLAYEIEDFTDCFLRKIVPGRAWRSAMRMIIPSSIQIDWKIRELKNKSTVAAEMFKRYVDTNKDHTSAPPPPLTVVASHLSMEDAAVELLHLAIREPSEPEKKLKVISIVGYGTLCNTFVVDKVYDANEVCSKFRVRARVSAANKDVKKLVTEIREHLQTGRNIGATTSVAVPPGLRYLIVVDNVEIDKLDTIIKHCDNEEEDVLLVATTDCTKAIHCKCSSVAPHSSITAQYLEIGELKNTTGTEGTGRLEHKLQDVLVSNYAKSLSTLAFEECLLYLCMFPHDHLVRWNLLIMRYMAEGIVFSQQEIPRAGEFCSAQKFLKILIDHNVVQSIQVSKMGKVKRCQPHVMMLDHISGMSKSKNFFALFCGSKPMPCLDVDEANPIRRLSLHGEIDRLRLPKGNELSLLRTLVVFHTGSLALISELPNYKLLRVLDLKKCVDVEYEHVKKICDLLLLKYLGLGEGVKKIPRKIANLEWLQTLDMIKSTTVDVPVEIMELPRLKHLLGKFQLCEEDTTKMKREELLSTRSKLERLSGFFIDNSKAFQQLMSHMKNLKKVKIWCDKENWTDDVTAAINRFTKEEASENRSLSIECDEYPSKIVTCLQYPGTSLSSLKLCGDLKTNLGIQEDRPTIGLQFLGLRGIKVLCLSGTNLSGAEILSILKLFAALTSLKLVEKNIGPLEITPQCLCGLTRLCLVATDTLSGISITAGALLCLVSLRLLYTNPYYLPGIDITSLKYLEEIGLHSGVPKPIKEYWQKNASEHKKKPKVVCIQSPGHYAV